MFSFTESPRLTEFERQVLPHLDAAYNLARFLMRNDQNAEDVVQEAALRAFRFFDSFRGENSRAWFLSIVRNTAFTALKRNRMDEETVVFDEELHGGQIPPLDAGIALDRAQDRQTVRAAIEQLPAEFREAITLRELEGMSYKEIADVAGVPIGTIMSRLARAPSSASTAPDEKLHRDQMSAEHENIRELLHAYVDGELDLANTRETERHLQSCADCRGIEKAIRELRSALTSDATAYRAPARLRKNVRAALRREAKSSRQTLSPWLMFATGAAFAAVILGFALFQTTRATRTNAIVDQVVANHVRSLLAVQLVDVVSSDQHTVKPWFDGKIDFAPEVRDLSANGFPLVGGRLDYLDGKTVAALVYQRNKHPINLFITPESTSRSTSPTVITRRGYNVFSWTNNGMKCWAVSDLNQAELRGFTELVRAVK